MSRIVITTWGSAGDLHPYIAVGRALQSRGHDVRCAVDEPLEPPFLAAGLPTIRLAGARGASDAAALHADPRKLFAEVLFPRLPAGIAALRAACAGADLLISSAFQLAASFVADLAGIPWATLALVPFGMDAREIDAPLDAFRARYGLPPLANRPLAGNLSPACTIVAVSPALMPRPENWPPSCHLTGFCFWDGGDAWAAPEGLDPFFSAGAPVVALSCGSMARDHPGTFDATFRAGVATIRRAGARALVIGAPAGVLPDAPSADLFALPYAPFSRVYPRCAAVIHHGGIGTTAQALRAGIPALLVPWGLDQFGTAEAVAASGAGLWLTREDFAEERAAAALRRLLTEGAFRERAHALANRIESEAGLESTCAILEQVLARPAGR